MIFVLEVGGVGGGELEGGVWDDIHGGEHWWSEILHVVTVWTVDHDAGGAGVGAGFEDAGHVGEGGVGRVASHAHVGVHVLVWVHVARIVQVEVGDVVLDICLVKSAVRVSTCNGWLPGYNLTRGFGMMACVIVCVETVIRGEAAADCGQPPVAGEKLHCWTYYILSITTKGDGLQFMVPIWTGGRRLGGRSNSRSRFSAGSSASKEEGLREWIGEEEWPLGLTGGSARRTSVALVDRVTEASRLRSTVGDGV